MDGYGINALNSCIEKAKKICKEPFKKRKLVMSLPEPIPNSPHTERKNRIPSQGICTEAWSDLNITIKEDRKLLEALAIVDY